MQCSRCGKPTCAECTFVVDVGQRCPECIARREIRQAPSRRLSRALLPRPTVVTPAIIGLCVAVFFIDSATGRRIATLGMSQPYLVYRTGEWWRILTAIFLHAGLLHLLFNMYALYITGSILEEAWGSLRLLAAFMVTGVFASLVSATTPVFFHSAVQLTKTPGSVGASGAIFGLFGALGVAMFRRRHSPWARSNLAQIGLIVAVNLAIGFMVPGIDNLAHLGGLVSGSIIGAGFDASATEGRNAPMIVSLSLLGLASLLLFVGGKTVIAS